MFLHQSVERRLSVDFKLSFKAIFHKLSKSIGNMSGKIFIFAVLLINKYYIYQWFPTGVPRHTKLSQRGVRGAAIFGNPAFLLMFYYIRHLQMIIFNQLRLGAANFFNEPKGAANQKKVEKHWHIQLNCSSLESLLILFLVCQIRGFDNPIQAHGPS